MPVFPVVVLEVAGLPYTHSGVLASAIAMDKEMAKNVVRAIGLRVPEGGAMDRAVFLKGHPLPPPYVVKPVSEGSSVGVVIVHEGANAAVPDLSSWSYGDRVMVERYIKGVDLTVSVMGDRPLAKISPAPPGSICSRSTPSPA